MCVLALYRRSFCTAAVCWDGHVRVNIFHHHICTLTVPQAGPALQALLKHSSSSSTNSQSASRALPISLRLLLLPKLAVIANVQFRTDHIIAVYFFRYGRSAVFC